MGRPLDPRARLTGHVWTIVPSLLSDLRPPHAISARPWSRVLVDPSIGEVRLSGALQSRVGSVEDLLIVVHGLAGHADRHYCIRAANAALQSGWDALRISLRGADRRGDDIYHAGLVSDLAATIEDPALARYRRIHLLGFSLGGHLVLRYCCDRPDPRVVAGATVCTPVHLSSASRHLDTQRPRWYRDRLLHALKQIYHACEVRGRARGDGRRVDTARSIREFDAASVVPRFGFADVDDYYESQSALQFLGGLKRPTLFVASTRDPMVPVEALRAQLSEPPTAMEVRWVDRGGHVGFPGGLDLGYPGARGLQAQILRWMAEQ